MGKSGDNYYFAIKNNPKEEQSPHKSRLIHKTESNTHRPYQETQTKT